MTEAQALMPRFDRLPIVTDADLHIIPQLRTYFRPENLPDPIDLHLAGHGTPRKPSGWFSPSTHPMLPLCHLVRYAAEPETFEHQEFEEEVMTSMLMGTIFHEIMNIAFTDMKIAVKPEGRTCPLCRRPRGRKPGVDVCNEHPVSDDVLKRRGHIDVVLDLPRLSGIAVDLKTCAPHALKSILNHDTSVFTKADATPLKRKYFGQGQEYIDLRGDDRFMFLFMALGFPWDMREIVIDRDQRHIDAVKTKYRQAREMAPFYLRTRALPTGCCPGGKGHEPCPR